MKSYFTSEYVSSGHPDKVADQISDALLDEFLKQDKNSHVACETLVTTGLAVVSGEVTTNGYVDIQKTVRDTIKEIGYNKGELYFDGNSCAVINTIHEQSGDIAMGVVNGETQGAGDQGIMFGYAIKNGIEYMPLEIMLARMIIQEIEYQRKIRSILRPDGKSQVTIEYDSDGTPLKIDTIVVSHQHNPYESIEKVRNYVNKSIENVISQVPLWVADLFHDYKLLVNPTGQFIIGGPHGDTGLTGRKIIVDTYGGRCPHGGGAFSGKDPSKVDRSASYFCRYIAKNLVAAGVADELSIEISYAIGKSEPISIFVNTYGTNHTEYSDAMIAQMLSSNVDFTPYGIINTLQLLNPIYLETAKKGHFGHKPIVKNGYKFFPWEELDLVEKFKNLFLK